MPLEHTPLDPSALSAAAARILGPTAPGPAKLMAAKGLAPMGPKDLMTVVYQLSLDADAQVRAAALQTADGLPDKILAAALGDALDARVLDFFARRVQSRAPLLEQVLLNRATHDETFILLAATAGDRELEMIAANQERLLRHPPIIEAIYFNRKARHSTVERLLEMAVRHGVTLDGIPQFKDIAASIMGSGVAAPAAEQAPLGDGTGEDTADPEELDMLFDSVLDEEWDQGPVGTLEYDGEGEREEKARKRFNELPVNARIRLATIGTSFHRMLAVRDSNRSVAMAAVQSPAVGEQEVTRFAANRGLSEDVIRYIANRKEWVRNYQVKVALVNNPKTPLASSMRLLRQLRANDLKVIARSKNIPAALAMAARQSMNRGQ